MYTDVSKDSEQTVEQNVTQTIHVTAQGQCSQSVCLNVYLKNEDGSAATDIDAVNLLTSDQLTDKNTQKTIDETLKDSVTLNNGTKASPTAEWKNDKDDNGTVTSKYLQITMPADAIAINFDMQLQYRTDEASYTKKVLVEAKAFEEEQDITEAAKREDESKENEVTVAWEGQAVSQSESEAADEDADGENESQVMAASAETGVYTLYFEQSTIGDTGWNNAKQISVYAFNSNSNDDNTGVLQMYKVSESDTKNIWKIMFDKKWTQVIFLKGNNWDGDSNQTEDIQINWNLNSPCYKLKGEAASDNKKKVDTPFEYKETPLAADGITVYYDATLSKLSYEDNKKGIPNPGSTTIYYYATNGTESTIGTMTQGCFMNYPWADLTYCILAITSLILFLIHWSCKKAQINSISLYRTFFQRYSFYIVNRDWLCLETHTVPAKRHCHKSSPSFLSLYLPDPSRTLPDAGCCMRIF